MGEFVVLSCNAEIGRAGSFDHAEIVIGKRRWGVAETIAIVLNEPGRAGGFVAAARAATGAALGSLFGKAGGVVGAAVAAGASATTSRKTQAAIVFADGVVVVAEVDDLGAGALLLMSRAVAAHHAQWGAPSPRTLPSPDGSGRAVSAEKLLAALPSSDAIAATTRQAIAAVKRVDWPEIPNPFRKK